MVTTRRSSRGKPQNLLDVFGGRSRQRMLGVKSAGIQWLGLDTTEHPTQSFGQQAVYAFNFAY